MSSDHSDLWAGIGAVVSSALSVLAWFHSIGLTALFTFVAGSLFTLWRVERLEKKRRKRDFDLKMTEHIYGPLHKGLFMIRGNLDRFDPAYDHPIENAMKDWRFNLVGDDLSSKIKDFTSKLPPLYFFVP